MPKSPSSTSLVYSRKSNMRQASDDALRNQWFESNDLSPKVIPTESRCYRAGKNLLRQNVAMCYKPMICKRLVSFRLVDW